MTSSRHGRAAITMHGLGAVLVLFTSFGSARADLPGDSCAIPFEIPSLPFSTTNNTCAYAHHYNAVCPYMVAGAPDIVYRYTTGASNQDVTITLCNDATNYDTKLYVFAGDCSGIAIYCNDDRCSTLSYPDEWVSELQCVTLLANTTYYIVVDGYDGVACGTYHMTIDVCVPCMQCPLGGIAELEPCGEDTNGGCNMVTPAFEPIACGETKCGTGWFDGATRDTDWYELTLASSARITLEAMGEFDILFGILVAPCPVPWFLVDAVADACVLASVTTTDCLPPGTYYIWAGPQFNYTSYCPANYYIRTVCTPCTAGACCLDTYECRFLEPAECAALGGAYQGHNVSCAAAPCPLPPGDTCGNPRLIGALPFAESGNTCGAYHNDYDSVCPFDGSTAPDVIYAYAPQANMTVSVDLCACLYDSKVYVFEDSCATSVIACNDDACGVDGYRSRIDCVALRAGHTYYIVIDGYGGSCGDYELSVAQFACDPVGACCTGSSCAELTQADCTAVGGFFQNGPCAGGAGHVPLYAGDGIAFRRVDFTFELTPWLASDYGLCTLDFAAIHAASGISSGFVNVATANGWVVRNVPYGADWPTPGVGVLFNLGPDLGDPGLYAYATASSEPVICRSALPVAWFYLGPNVEWNAEGEGQAATEPVTSAAGMPYASYDPNGPTYWHQQSPFPNIEQDDNQCCPASIANSLQWLEDTAGIDVPHEHRPGILDDSLVGELDADTFRPAHWMVPSPSDGVNGKLEYINNNGLADDLDVKHKQAPDFEALDGDQAVGDAYSRENTDSSVSLFEWIEHEIAAGEDVELRVQYPEGGHWVRVTGAGRVCGVPAISWSHDANQGADPNEPGGVARNGGTGPDDGGQGTSTAEGGVVQKMNRRATLDVPMSFAVSESAIYPNGLPLADPENRRISPTQLRNRSGSTKYRASQYTATRVRANGGFREDGKYKDRFADPVWVNDTTLRVGNAYSRRQSKELYLNLRFETAQSNEPNITIQTSSGQAPIAHRSEFRDYGRNLLIVWILPDQPEWEEIVFPDASYKNFDNLDRMGICTYCQLKPDADHDGVDDRLQIIQSPEQDQNHNGILDPIDQGDCNNNLVPDMFEIQNGFSQDCDENGLPDQCDLVMDPNCDCDQNGQIDSCETLLDLSIDLNTNRVPDVCDAPEYCRGDADCDGDVDFFDIDPFVGRLGCPGQGPMCHGGCAWQNCDVDQDGDVDFFDIDPFVARLGEPCR